MALDPNTEPQTMHPLRVWLTGQDASGATVGNVAAGATDSGNPVKVGGIFKTTPDTVTNGQRADLQTNANGALRVILDAAGGAGAAVISNNTNDAQASQVAMFVASQNKLWNGTTWDREGKAASTARLLSAANTTNATSVKASAGNLFKITGYNAAAALRYLKLYNKASAPTVGSDTPIWTEVLKASDKFSIDFGAQPLYFATGIAFAITTAGADADTGALTAADVTGLNIAYT